MKKFSFIVPLLLILLTATSVTGDVSAKTISTITATTKTVSPLVATTSTVYTTSDGLFNYTIDSSNIITLTKYLGKESVVNIPQIIKTKTVKYIGKNAFYNNTSVTEVNMGKVNYIGAGAFSGCTSLKKVTLPENTFSIGTGAFTNCPIKNVTLSRDTSYSPYEQISFRTLADWTTVVNRMDGVNINNVTEKFYVNGKYIKNLLTNYTYFISNGEIMVVRYTGTDVFLTIPSDIDGLPVTTLYPSIFPSTTKVEILYLPLTVTKIDETALKQTPTLRSIQLSSEAFCVGEAALIENLDILTLEFTTDATQVTETEVIEVIVNQLNMDPATIEQVVLTDSTDQLVIMDIHH